MALISIQFCLYVKDFFFKKKVNVLILLFQDKDLKRRLKSRSAIEQKVWKVSCSVLKESTPKKKTFSEVFELF